MSRYLYAFCDFFRPIHTLSVLVVFGAGFLLCGCNSQLEMASAYRTPALEPVTINLAAAEATQSTDFQLASARRAE